MVTRADLADTAEPSYLIPLGDIAVAPDRLRSLKPADADAFAVALAADGQYEPIVVTQLPGRADFLLVDGLHRLEGALRAGWASIEARIVAPDAAARVRREVLSEVVRAASDAFDMAAQVKALVDLARAGGVAAPVAPRGDAESAMIALTLGWDEATCETLGVSRRTVFNYLKLAETFDASWIERLRRLGCAGQLVPLLLLARQEPRVVGRVIGWLEHGAEDDGLARHTIAEAIAAVTGAAKPTAEDKRFNAVIGNLGRMAAPQRSVVVQRIVAQFLTDADLDAIVAQRRSGATRGRGETLAERVERTGSID